MEPGDWVWLWGFLNTKRNDGGHYTLVDEDGKVLTKTALPVYEDDEFITLTTAGSRWPGLRGTPVAVPW